MFTAKKTSLFEAKTKTTSASNAFVNAGLKKTSKTTALGNNAVKFVTTGNDFVDQFGKLTQYRAPRSYAEVSKDMQLLWSQDPNLALRLTFFTRLITRKVQLWDGTRTSEVQRGQGLKNEGMVRMLWLAINHPTEFKNNAALYVSIGAWKDVFDWLRYDLEFNGWNGRVLDWNYLGSLILAGLENENTANLVKKYLPQIKAGKYCKTVRSQANNLISKWICSLLFGTKNNDATYKQYRKLKTSGTAHEWQKAISKKLFDRLDFNTVHGRALMLLVSGKFISKNGLEKRYEQWISEQPVAKFTGYPYELLAPVKSGYHNKALKKYQIDTINKQFAMLVETARSGMNTSTGFIVVGDTSSSMTSSTSGLKISSYDVMKSLALFFSELLEGHFKNSWIEFADTAKMHVWKGSTPVEKLQNDRSEAYGSTNFQGVAKLFVDILKKGVAESEFPTGIICISDGCFNSTGTNKTNRKQFLKTLETGGFSKDYIDNFKIVLWDIPNGYYGGKPQTAFESFADAPNMFYMSGLDGSTVSFVLGGTERQPNAPKTAEELFQAAMDQEVLNLIKV